VRRVARPLSPALASILEEQNARYAPSPARDAHLRSMRSGASAVVTGQQTGLFLGPLYTVYKAAAAIRLARSLSQRWRTAVVPVFWLQTEDHDAAEIAICHVARGNDEPLTLRLDVAPGAVSVAHRVLPEAIEEILAALGNALSGLHHADEHLGLLARHYRPGVGWGPAFAGVLATLFAEEGLVLLDPRDPALAALAAPVHRRALTASRSIAGALVDREHALESAGWHPNMHVREEAPLSFFHPDGPLGPRCRLAAAPDGFVEVGGQRTHTLEDLLAALDADPAAFSTSALLRPILQDTWLPTVAYVGGPAEVAYFAQMPPLYAAFDVPAPIVVPRTRLRLLDQATRRALTRRGLTAAEVCRPIDDVLTSVCALAPGELDGDTLAQRVVDGIERVLADVAPAVRDAGEHALQALEKTRASFARSAEKLGRNYDKARLMCDRELVDDVRSAHARLMPGGVLQERHVGLASFAARYGQRAFIERVLAAAEPLKTGIVDLDL
jgi:bacillithiol biosynthesis cysteine-adding enzyme BshC